MGHRTPSPRESKPTPSPRVRRRADGIVEIVPARPLQRGPWRGAAVAAVTTILTMVLVLALAPLALVLAPLLYLAPALALPRAIRSLRLRARARHPSLQLIAPPDSPRLRGVGR